MQDKIDLLTYKAKLNRPFSFRATLQNKTSDLCVPQTNRCASDGTVIYASTRTVKCGEPNACACFHRKHSSQQSFWQTFPPKRYVQYPLVLVDFFRRYKKNAVNPRSVLTEAR